METLSATEARKQLFSLLQEGKSVEIRHPKNSMVLLPKMEFDRLWRAMINQEIDEALERAKGQSRYTTEEVETMVAEVLSKKGFQNG